MKPFEIFRAGTHTPMNGDAISFSAADLEATARAYNPSLHEAPLVVGHPAIDAPAYGWVERVGARDGVLVATPAKVDPAFAEILQAGRYQKVSASFFRPDSKANPTPGVWALRHVGFLGAAAPAVKGLKPIQFSSADDGVVEFAAMGESPAFAEMQRKVKDYQRADLIRFLDELMRQGRLTPAQRQYGLAQFMEHLSDDAVVEFADADGDQRAGSLAWFKRWLTLLPVQINFSEFGGPDKDADTAASFSAPPGFSVDASRAALHNKALAYQREHKCDYETAVLAVAKR